MFGGFFCLPGWHQKYRRRCRAQGRRSCRSDRPAYRWEHIRRQQLLGMHQRRRRAYQQAGTTQFQTLQLTSKLAHQQQPERKKTFQKRLRKYCFTFEAEESSGLSLAVSSCPTNFERSEPPTDGASSTAAEPPSSAGAKLVARTERILMGSADWTVAMAFPA